MAGVIDLNDGMAMIVTDLHGAWEVYARLRDLFLRERERGVVDRLVLCGDLIHGDGDETDRSLDMLLDVMRLQADLGTERVVMLLGNHELPHIYSVPLSRGDKSISPPFEAALAALDKKRRRGPKRAQVIDFLISLPLFARTRAGVLLTHAGAAPKATSPEPLEVLLGLDHRALLGSIDTALATHDLAAARAQYEGITGLSYDRQARDLLAVGGADDPRYNDLLRGMIVATTPEFTLLWDTLMNQNEAAAGLERYTLAVSLFLSALSRVSLYPQRVLVAGHMAAPDGYMLVGEQQLRLASYSHARPRSAGRYLLLDCAAPVQTAADLLPGLRPTFA